jgi:hypothetical protein
MTYFLITTTMKNGDKWETRRHTKKGMKSVVEDILTEYDDVDSFYVVKVVV